MNATDVLVMSVASYFVNMYFLGCLRTIKERKKKTKYFFITLDFVNFHKVR